MKKLEKLEKLEKLMTCSMSVKERLPEWLSISRIGMAIHQLNISGIWQLKLEKIVLVIKFMAVLAVKSKNRII